ncbi:MAG: Cof-type HAD-IIB family hydrolase [Nitrosopumilus sp.]|nr:Cof-type HAD-IIB family hydrolase [Nitrosopumilus sp.]
MFSSIRPYRKNMLKLKTEKAMFKREKEEISALKKKLEDRPYIVRVTRVLADPEEVKKTLPRRYVHLFTDIDSTLTCANESFIDSSAKLYIDKLQEMGCRFYFCSGRDRPSVNWFRKKYNTGSYAIAENGGIVIGMEDEATIGNKREPNKLLKYLKGNPNTEDVKMDDKQNNRETEVVLLKNSITEAELKRAIRNSRARVEYHAGKNTYHITARGVNKGTAIGALKTRLNIDDELEMIVGMGDSMLDVPMFKKVEKAFVVNPDRELKKAIRRYKDKVTILSAPPKAIREIYKVLFPYS